MPPSSPKPYILVLHLIKRKRIIEFRPRHGFWQPFILCMPIHELEIVQPELCYGAKNKAIECVAVKDYSIRISEHNQTQTFLAPHLASKDFSYYIKCNRLPSYVIFGQVGEEYYKEFIKQL